MTLTVELPEKLGRYVRRQMSKLGYKSASEYLAAVLEAEQHRSVGAEVEELLLEALEEPSSPLTEADFKDIERIGSELLKRRRNK
jgi:Arc/MetJ-type ribon-helix-helix transcriptional regulator